MAGKRARCCLGILLFAAVLPGALWLGRQRDGAVRAQPAQDSLAATYAREIRPLLARYCHKCHSGKNAEAEIDLASFGDLAAVRKATRVWLKVAEMLDSGQMPPREARQPSEDERARLQAWIRAFRKGEARARAGDPGRVVLRRLSNAEYTYTIRDLTGIDSLQPAREFPVDGAAGEGFTNTGDALAMSPALLAKYLQAARGVAEHAVLLPDGLRFSPSSTRRNWTNEKLAEIRAFYGQHAQAGAADPKGTQFYGSTIRDRSEGGVIPLERYLAALLNEGKADEKNLSKKYLDILARALNGKQSSLVLDPIRARWRSAKRGDEAALARDILQWQQALWRFNSVGHIGKVGGPKAWLEPISPLRAGYEAKLKMPATTAADGVTFYLAATDLGGGDDPAHVVWNRPRFVAPGRPDILLKDVRHLAGSLIALRARIFADTDKYLLAAEEATHGKTDTTDLARKHGIDVDALRAWLDCLGIGTHAAVKVTGHFTDKFTNPTYTFVKGWGPADTPILVANASDQHVRIPGNLKPHSVAVHPSPTMDVAVGWQSPIAATVRVVVKVAHAHPECGNGVTWSIEQRRGTHRYRLATGIAQGGTPPKIAPLDKLEVQKGDLLSVVIGPRNGDHACDLTAVDLTISAGEQTWDLAKDVSGDVHAGNPHNDQKNVKVWHFYVEPGATKSASAFVVPKGSLLDRWRSAASAAERTRLAGEVKKALLTVTPPAKDSPDAGLVRQLSSLHGPILGSLHQKCLAQGSAENKSAWGLDPAAFGTHPDSKQKVDPASLCVRAPKLIEVRVPAELVAGYEFWSTGTLHDDSRQHGCVQLQVLNAKPEMKGRAPVPTVPLIVAEKSEANTRLERAFDEFRAVFPAALCYTKIVPVDEVVTLTIHYREDDHLCRLFLDADQKAKLDRLWDELHYISQDALALVDGLEQLIQFATQDGDPKLFEPLRKPYRARADTFRQRLIDTQPKHLEAVLAFAGLAYRRPLLAREKEDLAGLYRSLRKQDMTHDDAVRLTLARVLVAPAFLYRLETPGPESSPVPVTDVELASRLSYFLWSSAPDAELTRLAVAGKLHDPDVLVAQTKRMLRDPRVRRLAIEFGCQWLHIRGFDESNEKSEHHFPTFAGLRSDMYEESILFFEDLFRRDRSVLDLLDADDTFLNEPLAQHYGIPGVKGKEWRQVHGVKKHSRGGILAQATTLATQSGASRTSPVLRGNWISEVLLGEKLPRPPKGVPQLPEDETKTEGLTVRQLVERHASDAKCAVCHKRIDAYGFSLEGFDAIGRRRDKDLANRPIDTKARTVDGSEFEGLGGLRQYLLSKRKDAFVRQFCKKLLGYALARGVQLSDEPLLDDMQERLQANDYRVTTVLESIVRSRQFREIRGSKFRDEE